MKVRKKGEARGTGLLRKPASEGGTRKLLVLLLPPAPPPTASTCCVQQRECPSEMIKGGAEGYEGGQRRALQTTDVADRSHETQQHTSGASAGFAERRKKRMPLRLSIAGGNGAAEKTKKGFRYCKRFSRDQVSSCS